MKDIGVYLVKISMFLFVAAGAGLASIGMPLAHYAKEARLLQFQVEESMGLELTEENCTHKIALDHIAECRSALYTQKITVTINVLLVRWVNIFLLLGVACFLIGSTIYIRSVLAENRERESDQHAKLPPPAS